MAAALLIPLFPIALSTAIGGAILWTKEEPPSPPYTLQTTDGGYITLHQNDYPKPLPLEERGLHYNLTYLLPRFAGGAAPATCHGDNLSWACRIATLLHPVPAHVPAMNLQAIVKALESSSWAHDFTEHHLASAPVEVKQAFAPLLNLTSCVDTQFREDVNWNIAIHRANRTASHDLRAARRELLRSYLKAVSVILRAAQSNLLPLLKDADKAVALLQNNTELREVLTRKAHASSQSRITWILNADAQAFDLAARMSDARLKDKAALLAAFRSASLHTDHAFQELCSRTKVNCTHVDLHLAVNDRKVNLTDKKVHFVGENATLISVNGTKLAVAKKSSHTKHVAAKSHHSFRPIGNITTDQNVTSLLAKRDSWVACEQRGNRVLCCDKANRANGAITDELGQYSRDCIPATEHVPCKLTDDNGYINKYDHGPLCCGERKKPGGGKMLTCAKVRGIGPGNAYEPSG